MARVYHEGDEPVPGSGYRLVSFLGRGGFGEVWKATAPGGAFAAVKILRLAGAEGRKELRALQLVKKLASAFLTPIHALWLKAEDGTVLDPALTDSNELLDRRKEDPRSGQTMVAPPVASPQRPAELIIAMGLGDKSLMDCFDECLAKGLSGIPVKELLGYMEDTARAIDFLNSRTHDLGSGPVAIQHCDIKPHNLLIVGDAIQVCDFGLARILGADRTTNCAATIPYAAPECLAPPGRPSESTDQYSLAITYYEMRAGKLPYEDETIATVLHAKQEGQLDFSGVSHGEKEVLRRATAVRPAERYASAAQMVRALRDAVRGLLTDTEPRIGELTVGVPPKRPLLSKLVRFLGYSLVVIALAVGIKEIVSYLRKDQISDWVEKVWPPLQALADQEKKQDDIKKYKDAFEGLTWTANTAPSGGASQELKRLLLEHLFARVHELSEEGVDRFVRAMAVLQQAPASVVEDKEKRLAKLEEGWKERTWNLATTKPSKALEVLDEQPPANLDTDFVARVNRKREELRKILHDDCVARAKSLRYPQALDWLVQEVPFLSLQERLGLRKSILADWSQQLRGMPYSTIEEWKALFTEFDEFSLRAKQSGDENEEPTLRRELIDRLVKAAEARGTENKIDDGLALLDAAPPTWTEDSAVKKCRTDLDRLRPKQVGQLIAVEKYHEAWACLKPMLTAPIGAEAKKLIALLRTAWSKDFKALLKESDAESLARARRMLARMLDPAPPWVDTALKESLDAELRTAEKKLTTEKWLASLTAHISAERFPEAHAMLKNPHQGVEPAQVVKYRDRVRTGWLEQVTALWKSGTPSETRDSAKAAKDLFDAIPECHEAGLLYARALIAQKSYRSASDELKRIPAPVQKQYQRLWEALNLIADAEGQRRPLPDELKKRLADLRNIPTPLAPWDLNKGENAAIEKIEREIIPPPPPPPPPRTFEQLLAQVKSDLGANQPADARKHLDEARQRAAAPGEKDLVTVWDAIVTISDPGWMEPQVAVALDVLETTLAKASAGECPILPTEMPIVTRLLRALADKSDGLSVDQTDRAIRTVRAAWKSAMHPTEAAKVAVGEVLATLSERRLAIYLTTLEPAADLPVFKEFWKNWDELRNADVVKKPGAASDFVKAARCEYLVAVGDRGAAMNIAVKFPAGGSPYVRYVRALAFQSAAPPWRATLAEVEAVFKAPDAAPEVRVPERREKAITWALSGVEEVTQTTKTGVGIGARLNDPFRSAAAAELNLDADRCFNLLQSADGFAGEALKAADLRAGLAMNRALAAVYKKDPDWTVAEDLTRQLHEDSGWKNFKFDPVLFWVTYLKSRLSQSGTPTPQRRLDVLEACPDLLAHIRQRLQDLGEYRLSKEDAESLYKSVLQPSQSVADAMKMNAGGPAEKAALAKFYAAVGEFVADQNQKATPWPFANRNQWAVGLLDEAINFGKGQSPSDAARLARLSVLRGRSRLADSYAENVAEQKAITDVLNDGKQALDYQPALHGAHALLCSALLRRAKGRQKREDLLADLNGAIASGRQSVDPPPKDDPLLPKYLIEVSTACVYRANYDHNESNLVKDLHQARKYAEDASNLAPASEAGAPNLHQDFPYLALGNAYEDLACLVPAEDEKGRGKYYRLAIQAFENAKKKTYSSAGAYCGAGRCYYRAIAETGLKPGELDEKFQQKTPNEVIDLAKLELTLATNQAPDLADAHYYLGKACLFQHKYEDADKHFAKAKTEAEKLKLQEWAIYVRDWARCLIDKDRIARAKPQDAADLIEKAKGLARELEMPRVPPGASLNPLTQAARIRSQALYCAAKYEEAEQECKNALPPDLAQATFSDADLLLQRAKCNIALAYKHRVDDPKKAREAADAVIRDAKAALTVAIWREQKATAHTFAANGYACKHAVTKDEDSLNAAIASVKDALLFSSRGQNAEALTLGVDLHAKARVGLLQDKLARNVILASTFVHEVLESYAQAIDWQKQYVDSLSLQTSKLKALENLAYFLQQGVQLTKTVLDDAALPQQVRETVLRRALEWQRLRIEIAKTLGTRTEDLETEQQKLEAKLKETQAR